MSELGVLGETRRSFRLAPEMELKVRACACEMAESICMSTDKVEEVGMAVVEACINAVEHSGAADGKLDLELVVLGSAETPIALRITIRDRGRGFDPSRVSKPSVDTSLQSLRKRGWGLTIIQGLMDEVDVLSSEDGTSVVMKKVL